jgi:hypothetical protein
MCQKCLDAVRKYWPGLSSEDMNTLLWEGTAFPFGSGDVIAGQLKKLAERSGRDLEKALTLAWNDMSAAMAEMERRERTIGG